MSRLIKQAAVLALATVLTGCATSPTGRSQFMLTLNPDRTKAPVTEIDMVL